MEPGFGPTVPLKVDISVGGRFHAFDLARELDRFGMLGTLHTGYPAFAGPRFGVPRKRVRSVWTHEPLNRLRSRLHRYGVTDSQAVIRLADRFDAIVARRIAPGSSVFVGWSNQCRRSLRRAAEFGMRTIVERGSTHIAFQRAMLQEESELTGLPSECPDDAVVAREEAEYAAADYIALPSRFALRTFVERGFDPSRLLLNPYGVDLELFQPRQPIVRSERAAHRDGLRILHVGRVSTQKGAHYLARAVRRVAGARLTFVGAFDAGIPALLGDGPHLVGAVPGNQLPEYYADADVFALLSVQEGLALVLLQAMAMGLPIVATENTGAADLITDGVEGFIVPARDPDAAAARFTQLTEDPMLRQEMGERARLRVRAGFGWHDYGERARRNYARVCGVASAP